MNQLNVVVALITSDNDYQAEQAASATEAAIRLGAKIQIIYADNDAVNQTQQLVKIIQATGSRPDAIIVEPVGTEMIQVARAAVAAGMGWAILNRESEYMAELRRVRRAPVFAVTTDQVEVGRIQARQFAALVKEGNILYIEGPSGGGGVSALRTKGMLSNKPAGLELKMIKGDWTERSGHHAIKSWLALSTSRKLDVASLAARTMPWPWVRGGLSRNYRVPRNVNTGLVFRSLDVTAWPRRGGSGFAKVC